MRPNCLARTGLILTALLIVFRLEAADQHTRTAESVAKTEAPPLIFWAVNEGGARIYQPNSTACAKISGLSAQYAESISVQFTVPAYTIKLQSIKPNADLSSCALMIDTPEGLKECTLGSVIRTFGGDYLAHTYRQFPDGRVSFISGACH